MDIRTAILKAANHIEANPGEFDFHSLVVPGGPGCGTPGCAIGWIEHFAGSRLDRIRWDGKQIFPSLKIDSEEFVRRMGLVGARELLWTRSASGCAIAMRRYADKHYPEETTEQYPEIMAELDRISQRVAA